MWVHPGSSEPGRIPPIVGTVRDGTSAPCEHTVQRRARAPPHPHPPIKKKQKTERIFSKQDPLSPLKRDPLSNAK